MGNNSAMSTKATLSTAASNPPASSDAAALLWQWDPTSDRLFVNGDTESALLVGRDTITSGRLFLRRLHAADLRRHVQRMNQLTSGVRRSFNCASRIETAQGPATLRLEALPLRAGDGRVLQIYGSAILWIDDPCQPTAPVQPAQDRDIDSSCLEQSWLAGISALEAREFAQARLRRVEELNKRHSMLLAHVTHELKNAINAVGGYGDMIEADAIASDRPHIARWAASIAQARDHAKELIDNVLDACRLDAGQSPVEIDKFDLLPALEEVVAIAQPLADRNTNRIALDAASAPMSMRSDQLKLRQILINLLSNAAKFTHNGQISLTVRHDGDGKAVFEVADSGVGMTRSQLDRLFKPFSQVGDRIDRRGTGLGLHITHNICRLLGGTIGVESVAGQGSRFRVTLPIDATIDPALVAEGVRPELVIGTVEGLTSLDPHVPLLRSTWLVMGHMLESLTEFDEDKRVIPSLATRWFAVDSRTWLFELRSGVRFHDNSEFSGEDVIASFQRLERRNKIDPFIGAVVSGFAEYRLISPYKLLIRTKRPWPTLPAEMSEMFIINRRFADADSEAFDSLAALVGTGPYRLTSAGLGQQLRCEAFAGHWRGPPAWRSVMFRFIPDEVDLVDALAAGRIDVVDDLHPHGQRHVQDVPDLSIASCDGGGFYHLAVKTSPATNPRVTDRAGRPLPTNPLSDVRVRKAISYAIDRQFLCKHIMMSNAKPAGDVVPSSVDGSNPDNRPDHYDPKAARRLLAEAGYADGFSLALTTPDDMAYLPLAQAISIMLSSIGIDTRYEALDTRAFYANHFQGDFAAALTIWHDTTGEASYTLNHLLGTINADEGIGSGNVGRYSNADFDRVLQKALMTGDRDERIKSLQEACAVGIADLPIIPLVEPSACWAMRRGYRVHANLLGMSWARFIERVPDRDA